VIVDRGQDRRGKLAQGVMHGRARVAVRGNSTRSWRSCASDPAPSDAWSHSVPFRLEGQKTAASRCVGGLGAIDARALPRRQRGQESPPTGKLQRGPATSRGLLGFQDAGARAAGHGCHGGQAKGRRAIRIGKSRRAGESDFAVTESSRRDRGRHRRRDPRRLSPAGRARGRLLREGERR